jgi:ankyrin repeat protein
LARPGANINTKNYVEETPLHLAAREGKLHMVTLLVSQFKIDIEQDTVVSPLIYLF